MKKILLPLFLMMSFLITSSYTFAQRKQNKRNPTLLEKKLTLLEKKIEVLEKKVITLEKKISELQKTDEFEIKFISKEVVETKVKGVVKIEALLKNNTLNPVKFISGQIHIINPLTEQELFSDNFYYDEPILPSESKNIIIAVPSTHSSYNNIRNLEGLKIKFTPKVIKN
ncbi:MAG: hypothetical protein ACP5IO_06845 [Elusimicrobiales bacterium]